MKGVKSEVDVPPPPPHRFPCWTERHDAKTVSQIHSFTSKLKRMQARNGRKESVDVDELLAFPLPHIDIYIYEECLVRGLNDPFLEQDDQQSLKRHTDVASYFNGVAKADSFTSLLEAEQVWGKYH